MLKGRRRKRMWYSGSRETAWKLRVCCFSHDSCWGQLASKFSKGANDELTISSDLRCFISLYILRSWYISIHRCLIIMHLLRTWGRLFASVQTARTTTAVPFSFFWHLFSITYAMRLEASAPSFDEGEVQICWSSNMLGSDEPIIHSWSSTALSMQVNMYIKMHKTAIKMHWTFIELSNWWFPNVSKISS